MMQGITWKGWFSKEALHSEHQEPTMLGQPAGRGVLLVSKDLVPLAPSLLLHLLYLAVSEQMKKQLLYNICSVARVSYFCSLKASGITILPSHTQTKRVYHKKWACAEECKVYLCSLTQDLNFIKFYKMSIDSVSPITEFLLQPDLQSTILSKLIKKKIKCNHYKSEPLLFISVVHQDTLGFQCMCSAIMRVTVVWRALNLYVQKREVQI